MIPLPKSVKIDELSLMHIISLPHSVPEHIYSERYYCLNTGNKAPNPPDYLENISHRYLVIRYHLEAAAGKPALPQSSPRAPCSWPSPRDGVKLYRNVD